MSRLVAISAFAMLAAPLAALVSALPDQADRIVVQKAAHRMTLYRDGRVLRVYTIALGTGTGAAKQRRGDHETPEGLYVIDSRNAQSRDHLSLHVSYPNASDRQRAHRSNFETGGDIMIHGLPNGYAWLGSVQHLKDWTDGCIALGNAEMDEVWKLVPTGTPIEIRH